MTPPHDPASANPEAQSQDEPDELEKTQARPDEGALPVFHRSTPTRKLGWRPGQKICGQQIVDKLGKGTSGAVYLVEDPGTKELRALKAIPAPDAAARQRFEREVACQMGTGHPNVAECYGAGEWEGNVFLVAEFLPGGSLRQRLKREGPLAARKAAEIVAALADGLSAVHATGVLHHDLKPANVMFDEEGVPKLVDFGLAGASGEALGPAGEILQGTPAFMAPEQVKTSEVQLTEGTDVYGLGAVLYTSLTGELPYACKELMELVLEIGACDPIPPSERRPELSIPPALNAIVLKAMARRPGDRYASAADFAEALRAYLDA